MTDSLTTLIFDTSCLSCFARAGRLALLESLTDGYRRVVTPAVLDELDRGAANYPALATVASVSWLETVRADDLQVLRTFGRYLQILGGGSRNIGEAATLAWAEQRQAIAVIDDQTAVTAARRRGVAVRRTLAVVAGGVDRGQLTEPAAVVLVDELIAGGARFPCDGRAFIPWAREQGLLR
ncbi:MAG: hypothetical protein V1750_06090 [Acidobacteriota bacterium]